MSEPHTPAPSRVGATVGLVLLALNLRGPLVAISAVAVDLQTDLGMTAGTVGLLTSLPVLCFGLASPAASGLIGRLGIEIAVLATLLVIFIGILVRSAGAVPAAFVGTLLIGLAITVGNVLGPLIVGRDFRTRVAQMTGAYTAALNVGSMVALAVSGPLAVAFGWQVALAAGAVVPVLAAVVWVPLTARARRRRAAAAARPTPAQPDRPRESVPRVSVLRRPSTWLLTGAFAGQAYAYYGLTAWLPTVLGDQVGMTRGEAGAASSIFQIAALIGAFGAPVIINRMGGPLVAFLVNGVLWTALPLGLLLAPELWAVWSAASGIAQGGGFVTIFTVVVWRARSLRENRQLSSVVQTGGYCVACLGPTVLGVLRDSTGAWSASLLTAVVGTMTLMVLGALASVGLKR
ncbi:MFS transporter [Nakamurella multipartita]|uniref:Major facilitator superfamily MFS_1 n=1 Tax=Nakamurella multipartita (strain ATCC 700099 / DSM 44233 / CIP 104796 / JCM 9543 / NBRC 105858 / Y-104) TaxID=479431 RepID=C8X7A3_NAKMY|nr:MFS transporter [Nakamurella multipartita]ACV76972.1 major facilitator superfamily MFS_1 [Nakamurella multipartita DSM 44233]